MAAITPFQDQLKRELEFLSAEQSSGKRVLYLVDASVDVTGGFVGAQNIAKTCRPYAETVLVLPKESKIPLSYLACFSRVEYLPIVNLRKSARAVLLYIPALLIASWRLRKMLKTDGASWLEINDFYLMHGAVVRVFGFQGKIVTWVRFDPIRFSRLLSGAWLRAAAFASDEIVAVSEHVLRRLSPLPSIRLIYDPVPSNFAPSDPEGRHNRLVCIGNYIKGKGQDDALAAFAQVADRHAAATLHFYGGDMGLEKNRAYLEQLRCTAAKLGLSERVIFHGFTRDVVSALRSSLAALNFSESETFSLTCLEASSCGVAVIATRSGGPQEIIQDGRTGILVPVRDIKAMAKAMDALLSNPAEAIRMGEAGARHVRERFSQAAFADAIFQLFRPDAEARPNDT